MGPNKEIIVSMKKAGFYQIVEVSKTLKIPYSTITGWVEKSNISCMKNGRFQFVSEAEVKSKWSDFQKLLEKKEKKVEKKLEKKPHFPVTKKIEVVNGHGTAKDVIKAVESHCAAIAARADILLSMSKKLEEALEEVKECLIKLEKKWE